LSIHLALLGTFSLTRDGQPVDLRNRKARALLAYLALTPGQSHAREKLAGLLWGERFDEQARSSLRQALHALRKALGPEVIAGDSDLSAPSGAITVDALAYDAGDTPPWTGELMAGFQTGEVGFDDWLTAERTRIQRVAVNAFREGAARAKDEGRADEALALAETALEIDPFDEAALRLVMSLLATQDRRAEALSRHAAFTERLRRELDAEPSAETERLAEEIRAGEAKVAARVSSEPALTGGFGTILVAPIEDLGGGDTASFLAHEIPTEVVSACVRLGFLRARKVSERPSESDPQALVELLRSHHAKVLLSGSTRQLGDNVRISLRTEEGSDRGMIWSHTEVIRTDEAFDFIDGVIALLRQSTVEVWRLSAPGSDPIAALKAVESDPDEFVAVYNEHFWTNFGADHSLSGLAKLCAVNAYALSIFPRNALFLVGAGFVDFHVAHLSDGKDRIERYERALAFFRRALAIWPGMVQALHGSLIISNWLGRFDDVEAAWFQLEGATGPSLNAIYGISQMFRGRNEEAIDGVRETIAAERGWKLLMYRYPILGLAQFNMGDFNEALASAENALEVSHEFFLGHLVKIAALQRLGRADEAGHAIAEFREGYRDPTVAEFEFLPFTDEAPREAFLGALLDAGLPKEPGD